MIRKITTLLEVVLNKNLQNILKDNIFDPLDMQDTGFSLDNKNQQKNLIETIKQNCRRIVREKTGKKPFTNINIARV